MGRPPAWNPIAALDSGVWMETAAFASEDRLILPLETRRRAGWTRRVKTTPLLATLMGSGAIELTLWEPAGRLEMERLGCALKDVSASDRETLLFAVMDRYARASLARDGRLRLAPPMVAHFAPDERDAVRVAVAQGRVWLWPRSAWQAQRDHRFSALQAALGLDAARPHAEIQ